MFEIPLLGKYLGLVSAETVRFPEDDVDRLHRKVTVIVLILCAMFIGTKQQFGQPIQCMLPAHLDRSSWTSYGQYYCFVESTYRLTYNKTIPNADARTEHRTATLINYYQWVPFFLIIQAMCFSIPGWLWTILQTERAFDMNSVAREALSLRGIFKEEIREKKLQNIVEYVSSALKLKMDAQKTKRSRFLLIEGNFWSTAVHLSSKLLTTVNDLFQLYLIGRFIGVRSFSWSFTVLSWTSDPLTSPYFPRITFCDMERQTLGGMETNTLQCVLMLNFINEKIFFILWYWIAALFIISLGNFAYTLLQSVQTWFRENLIISYLHSSELDDDDYLLLNDERRLRAYIAEYLGLDGVLLLRFIHSHAGFVVARDIAVALWHSFCGTNDQDRNPYYLTRDIAPSDKESKITNVDLHPPLAVASFALSCTSST